MKKLLLTVFALCVAVATMAQTSLRVNLENQYVKKYLNDAKAKYTYSSSSRIGYHVYASRVDSTYERPNPVTIALDGEATEGMYAVMVNVDSVGENYRVPLAAGDTEAMIYNAVPGRSYRYEIHDGDEVVKSGEVTTEGRIRMLHLPSLHNLRDLGGHVSADGKHTTQFGLIYRGSALEGDRNVATCEDMDELKRLGIRAELDLRNIRYRLKGSPMGEEVNYMFQYMEDGLHNFYNVWDKELGEALTYVIDNLRHRRPVYIHCTFGADRTGVTCALIDGCIGVSCEWVYKDYELSTTSKFVGGRLKNALNERILADIGFGEGKDLQECCRRYVIDTLGVSEKDIDDLTAIMFGEYGYEDESLVGDVNGDKTVDALDVTTLIGRIIGSEEDDFVREAADVNNDGAIDVLDAISLIDMIFGVKQ